MLTAKVYTRLGERWEYVRQAGFSSLQQDQMIRQYVRTHGQIVRSDVVDLCGLGKDQATRLLARREGVQGVHRGVRDPPMRPGGCGSVALDVVWFDTELLGDHRQGVAMGVLNLATLDTGTATAR